MQWAPQMGFTGYIADNEAGLLHARARMYSPGLGGFLSRDRKKYIDGFSQYRGYFVPNALDSRGNKVEFTGPLNADVAAFLRKENGKGFDKTTDKEFSSVIHTFSVAKQLNSVSVTETGNKSFIGATGESFGHRVFLGRLRIAPLEVSTDKTIPSGKSACSKGSIVVNVKKIQVTIEDAIGYLDVDAIDESYDNDDNNDEKNLGGKEGQLILTWDTCKASKKQALVDDSGSVIFSPPNIKDQKSVHAFEGKNYTAVTNIEFNNSVISGQVYCE